MANGSDNIERDYKIDDIEMLSKAQLFHNTFQTDKAAFTALVSSFADPYAANFQTEIDTADDIPSDREIVENIGLKTEQITAKLDECKEVMQELFMFVKLCYPDSPATLRIFGQGEDYKKAYQSYPKMKEVLEKAHRAAESAQFKSTLIAKGFTQAKIDNIETEMNELDALYVEYDEAKSERLLLTENRIRQYNKVWEFMRTISEASKIVFKDSPAKIQQYLLYPTPSSNPHKVQGLAYNLELNKLTWNEAENADLYIVEAMQQFPLSEPTFTMRAETPLTEWIVALPPATYSFRIKGKNGGVSGPYSDSLDNVVIVP